VNNSEDPVENEFLIGGNERRDIVLVDYDPSWAGRFDDEWAKITTALVAESGLRRYLRWQRPCVGSDPDGARGQDLRGRPDHRDHHGQEYLQA
jgi:hypothetical protein